MEYGPNLTLLSAVQLINMQAVKNDCNNALMR